MIDADQSLPVLGSSRGDPHGPVAAVDTLHLDKGTLLVVLIREANEAVAAALARHGIGHDLGRLARREAGLEKGHKDVFIDLGAEIADEDGVLRTAVLTGSTRSQKRSPGSRWAWLENGSIRGEGREDSVGCHHETSS